jgi:hypothetical protein
VPLDYSTVYNITDADGNVLQRRYLGEYCFVLLVGRYIYGTRDLTDGASLVGPGRRGAVDGDIDGAVTWLPRSVPHVRAGLLHATP